MPPWDLALIGDGPVSRWREGERDWQAESKCNPGFDSVVPPSVKRPGRVYKLRESVPAAVGRFRVLHRLLGVPEGQDELALHERGKANSRRKRLNADGKRVAA